MTGYNPNRDSGIAEARSYIEIKQTDFPSGAVEEYNFVPTQRYFAQLVYNVGQATGGAGSGLTQKQQEDLAWLSSNRSTLEGLCALSLDSIEISIAPQTENVDLLTENTVIPIFKSENGQIEIIQDINDIDGNGDKTEYLINVQGFVCGVECYTWINQSANLVSTEYERFLPKMTYLPKTEEYPYGRTIVFLRKDEYDLINELPEGKKTIRIIYLRIPTVNNNQNN